MLKLRKARLPGELAANYLSLKAHFGELLPLLWAGTKAEKGEKKKPEEDDSAAGEEKAGLIGFSRQNKMKRSFIVCRSWESRSAACGASRSPGTAQHSASKQRVSVRVCVSLCTAVTQLSCMLRNTKRAACHPQIQAL